VARATSPRLIEAVNDDRAFRRALLKDPPRQAIHAHGGDQDGILTADVVRLLCTAGINIFGIALQVPFGKEMGFAGGIVEIADEPQGIINGTGRAWSRRDLRPVRPPDRS